MVGIVASKKVGKSTVRNKVRRQIREIYRKHQDTLCPGHYIVIVARAQIVQTPFCDIEKNMLALFKKHKLLQNRK